MNAQQRMAEQVAEANVAELTQSPEQLGAWQLIGLEYVLGHQYDREIVRALRALDPAVAPLWVWKEYKVPGDQERRREGRHLIARLVTDPRVTRRRGFGIRNVTMPSVMPDELKGLTSEGPYVEAELLEGESPDGGRTPGPYLPMTWKLVQRLEAGAYALRNHRMIDDTALLAHNITTASRRKERAARQQFADYVRSTKDARLQARGQMVRCQSETGERVSISETLLRLRKVAAEPQGASA